MKSMFRSGIIALLTFATVSGSHAATEIFNLDFNGDLAGFTSNNEPIVPTVVSLDTWTKCATGSPVEVPLEGGSVASSYMFNGNVRGISIALSSGFTPGTRYTLSARARKFYGGNNQRMVIAATQADPGAGDYLMDNLYNGTEESYQPVVVNSGDATVSNVLLKTLNVNSSWQTVSDTFVYDGSLGPNVVVQLQVFDTGGTTDGAIYYDDFVLSDNRAPAFAADTLIAPTGFVGVAYSLSLAGFVTEFEGDNVTFAKDAGDTSWINVSSAGLVTGTPTLADVGSNSVTVLAWDDQGSETNSAILQIVVSNENLPPAWAVGDFEMGYVGVGQSYSDSIAGRVMDVNGSPVTFAGAGGPGWLSIGADGAVSGTPSTVDIGTNSWSVIASDGELSSTSSFEIVVINAVEVYEETFSPSVELAGSFNNTIGGALFAYVTTELQPGMWAHTFSTNSDSFNLWADIGLTDVLEFAENGQGTKAQGVGTSIPASVFNGQAGKYVLTYSYVTNNYYDAVSRVGARIFEASRGVNADSSSDYFLGLEGEFVFNLGVGKPAGSDAYVSPVLAADTVSDLLGARMLEFEYSGTNDVVLLFGTFTPDGRARAAIDNIRVFKLPPSFTEWYDAYELLDGMYGDDDGDGVDNITEFGLGLDPTVAGGVGDGALPEWFNNGSQLIYIMAQRVNGGTLDFNLLTVDDLVFGTWKTNNTPAEYTVGGSVNTGGFNYVTNIINTGDSVKFVRPLVTENL